MDALFLEPWLPPARPDLARLAMEAADEAGLSRCDAWPEVRKGGLGFGDLPPFLAWHAFDGKRHHLILVQPREVGALVPGARTASVPEGWLEHLDLDALARPLSRHPAFPGGASVHVVGILAPGLARVRSRGEDANVHVAGVLARISAVAEWRVTG
jgi:hypothetical protein